MNSIELIEALVGQTDHDIKEFTGGAVIQTVINNKTIIKYKVSLYFGYENKKPLTRIIEIDKDVYFALPKALDDYLSNVVKRSDSKVFTMSRPTGRPTIRFRFRSKLGPMNRHQVSYAVRIQVPHKWGM